jgi:hypothetical protein
LRDLMTQALEQIGPRMIAVVACSNTEPGRKFLRTMSKVPGASVRLQRNVREALAVHRAASIAVSVDPFLVIADSLAPGLAAELHRMPVGPGIVPVVVLGADGAMTAFASLPSGDGTPPHAFLQAVQARADRAAAARQRRAERRQRYGTN